MDPSDHVRCPYDRAHLILKSKIQFHLLTDHPSYTGPKIEPCPFNTTHMIEVACLEEHKRICPDRGIVDTFVVSVGHSTPPPGVAPVTNYNVTYDESDDWNEQGSSVSVLDQIKQAAEEKPILKGNVGLPKAKKRDYILQERRRHQQIEASRYSTSEFQHTAPEQSSNSIPAATAMPSSAKHPDADPPKSAADPLLWTTNSQSHSNSVVDRVKTPLSESAVLNSNEADFPSLDGNAGAKSAKRNVATSGFQKGAPMKNPDLPVSQAKTTAWAKPLERSAQEEISVPSGMSRGGRGGGPLHQGLGGRSGSNPWGRGRGSTIHGYSPQNGSNGSREIDPTCNDEFPSLSQAAGKKSMW